MSQSKTEILELVTGLKALALDVKKVLKDGKVDMSDLGVIEDLMNQQADLTKALEGLDKIKIDELGLQDAIEILSALGEAGAAVAAA